MLGAQVRQVYFSENKEYAGGKLTLDKNWKSVNCAFGKQFLKLGALPDAPSEAGLLTVIPQKGTDEVEISGKKYRCEEYGFSWKQGVEGDPGHQGYHGLKGKMYDNLIRLGALKNVKMSKTRVPEPDGTYCLDGWRSNTDHTRRKATRWINKL